MDATERAALQLGIDLRDLRYAYDCLGISPSFTGQHGVHEAMKTLIRLLKLEGRVQVKSTHHIEGFIDEYWHCTLEQSDSNGTIEVFRAAIASIEKAMTKDKKGRKP